MLVVIIIFNFSRLTFLNFSVQKFMQMTRAKYMKDAAKRILVNIKIKFNGFQRVCSYCLVGSLKKIINLRQQIVRVFRSVH